MMPSRLCPQSVCDLLRQKNVGSALMISLQITISKHTAETVCWPDVRDVGPDLEEVTSEDNSDPPSESVSCVLPPGRASFLL